MGDRVFESIIYSFKTGGYLTKIIYLNVGIFIFSLIIKMIFSSLDISHYMNIVYLPSNIETFVFQPWSIVTYSFFHSGFIHLFFNLVLLNFSGNVFLKYFSDEKLLSLYILGIIISAGGYLLVMNFIARDNYYYLLGSSSAVYTILWASIFNNPNTIVRLFFNTYIKILYLGLIILALSLLSVSETRNYGGFISHIGGIFTAYIFILGIKKRVDITRAVADLVSSIRKIFSFKNANKDTNRYNMSDEHQYNASKRERQEKVDKILEKISKKGYESLSKEEKDFLTNN